MASQFKNLRLVYGKRRRGPFSFFNKGGEPVHGQIIEASWQSTNRYSPSDLRALARERGVGRPPGR